MKYFIDTEFLEGPQKEKFPISLFRKNTPNTIDLISIGIVAEDCREYYAISKDFNLDEAWNRYDEKVETMYGDMRNHFPEGRKYKEYWLRENVLKNIFNELYWEDTRRLCNHKRVYGLAADYSLTFCYKDFKYLIDKYGKTNKQITEDIKTFCHCELHLAKRRGGLDFTKEEATPLFYAYYADYDWVVFCWLFGKMMDLPEGFPMYCRDLKQIFDQKQDWIRIPTSQKDLDLKQDTEYPKQDPSKSHNAIEDARWNKKLYDFLIKI